MNKQEAIKEIKNLKGLNILDKTINFDDEMISKKEVLNIVKQLDEPTRPSEQKPLESEKPVIPQFVADWYEEHKDNFEYSVQCLCVHGYEPVRQIDTWFDSVDNKPIETLVMMHKFGYEIEKEKLYLASFRDTNQYLGWNEKLGEWFMSCSPFTSGVEQTQETWEGVGIWNNPAFEIKEVEE